MANHETKKERSLLRAKWLFVPIIIVVIVATGIHWFFKYPPSNIDLQSISKQYTGVSADKSWNGWIIITKPDGTRYEGNIMHGRYHGKGKEIYKNGGFYEGEFNNGEREGFGVLVYPDGTRYEGDFEHDTFNGKGKLISITGEIYDGGFVNGKKEGWGILRSHIGTRYEGSFADNKFSGKGRIISKTGECYEGLFVEGHAEGFDINKILREGELGNYAAYRSLIQATRPEYPCSELYNKKITVAKEEILFSESKKVIAFSPEEDREESGEVESWKTSAFNKLYCLPAEKGLALLRIQSYWEHHDISVTFYDLKGDEIGYFGDLWQNDLREISPNGELFIVNASDPYLTGLIDGSIKLLNIYGAKLFDTGEFSNFFAKYFQTEFPRYLLLNEFNNERFLFSDDSKYFAFAVAGVTGENRNYEGAYIFIVSGGGQVVYFEYIENKDGSKKFTSVREYLADRGNNEAMSLMEYVSNLLISLSSKK